MPPDCEDSARAREPGALSGIRPMRAGRTDGDAKVGTRGKEHRRHACRSHRGSATSLGLRRASPATPHGAGPSAREHDQTRDLGCRPQRALVGRIHCRMTLELSSTLSTLVLMMVSPHSIIANAPGLHRNSKNGSTMIGEPENRARSMFGAIVDHPANGETDASAEA